MSSVFTSVLPNNYRFKDCPYYHKVVNGVDFSFFINDSEVVDSGDHTFANLVLSVFDTSGVEVESDYHSLSKVDFSSDYRLYVDGANLTTLENGKIYRNVIYDNSDDSVVYVLPWFKFVNDPAPYVLVSYRNSSDIFNFSYEALPTFRNEVFLDFNVIDDQVDLERTGYLESSTGYYRNQKSQVQDYVTLETYFFDDMAHAGMKSLSAHDDIKLNGRDYQVKEAYEKETNIRNGQSKGTIEFWDQEHNEINLNI